MLDSKTQVWVVKVPRSCPHGVSYMRGLNPNSKDHIRTESYFHHCVSPSASWVQICFLELQSSCLRWVPIPLFSNTNPILSDQGPVWVLLTQWKCSLIKPGSKPSRVQIQLSKFLNMSVKVLIWCTSLIPMSQSWCLNRVNSSVCESLWSCQWL